MRTPKKTEALKALPSNKKWNTVESFDIYWKQITNSEISTHLGLKKANTVNATTEANVDCNIQKARRTAYNFMSACLHGADGSDVLISLHIIQMFISAVLDYGLEIVLPKQNPLWAKLNSY